jgi:hypothetical protein
MNIWSRAEGDGPLVDISVQDSILACVIEVHTDHRCGHPDATRLCQSVILTYFR